MKDLLKYKSKVRVIKKERTVHEVHPILKRPRNPPEEAKQPEASVLNLES